MSVRITGVHVEGWTGKHLMFWPLNL